MWARRSHPSGDASTLTGGGLIQLENGGDPNSATEDAIVSVTNSDTLENTNNTIAGYGFLGGSYLNLNNFATVDANVLGESLSIDGGSLNGTAGVIDNDGLMEASNGGTLVIKSAILNYANTFNPFEPVFFSSRHVDHHRRRRVHALGRRRYQRDRAQLGHRARYRNDYLGHFGDRRRGHHLCHRRRHNRRWR